MAPSRQGKLLPPARATVMVGLGSNRCSRWGPPAATIAVAVRALAAAGLQVRAVSSLYETAPLGSAAQECYVNAVALVATAVPPAALLRRLKGIERRAGRRSARPWGPRALDLDLLDWKGVVQGWQRGSGASGRHIGGLVLPHPRLHERPFVLYPLAEIAPGWRHPILRRTSGELARGVRHQRQGRVLKRLGPIPTS